MKYFKKNSRAVGKHLVLFTTFLDKNLGSCKEFTFLLFTLEFLFLLILILLEDVKARCSNINKL